MNSDKQAHAEKLAALQKRFAVLLPEKINKIEEHWGQLIHISWNDEAFGLLHQMVHSLSGAAGTFGFSDIGKTASKLDLFCRTLIETGSHPSAEQRNQIEILITKLGSQMALATKPQAIIQAVPKTSTPSAKQQSVFIVEDDQQYREYLASQIESFGYNVQAFADTKSMWEVLQSNSPVVIVMDIMLAEGSNAGIIFIAQLRKKIETPPRVIFVSARNDMGARLMAIRAGGDAYLSKPVNVAELAESLEQMTRCHDLTPSRVLVVDDDPDICEFVATALGKADILVHSVTDPIHMMEPLLKFKPDLILLDLYMPKCSGYELAKLIRQHHDFAAVPIVYLSAESDPQKQMHAMSLGGDDFLTKPVDPEHLTTTIKNRIRRSKSLAGHVHFLSDKDPVTGLFNRRFFYYELLNVVSAAAVTDKNASVLFIELDNTAAIRDKASMIGVDYVIGSTANLIRAQLVEDDLLTRLSDNTFGILARNRTVEDARNLGEKICQDLSQQVFDIAGQLLVTTCSIGIVPITSEHRSSDTVVHAACISCEQARNMGGNAVHVHDEQKDTEYVAEIDEQCEELLHRALEENRFRLIFQPIVNLSGDTAARYEILVRMDDLDGEEVLPGKFLPVAEKKGLLGSIDQWIFNHTIQMLKERDKAGEAATFFVKMSEASLKDKELPSYLEGLLKNFQFQHSHLVFELTDTLASEHLREAQYFCEQIKKLGCSVALEHFGTNLNSVQLLNHLPVDYVKIDGTFMHNLGSNLANQDSVRMLADHIHDAGALAIAEYVEDAASLSVLWQCRVSYMQGNFLQAPDESLSYDFSNQSS